MEFLNLRSFNSEVIEGKNIDNSKAISGALNTDDSLLTTVPGLRYTVDCFRYVESVACRLDA